MASPESSALSTEERDSVQERDTQQLSRFHIQVLRRIVELQKKSGGQISTSDEKQNGSPELPTQSQDYCNAYELIP